MEYKEILGALSALIALGVSLSYIYTIVRGPTKPHLYTFVIDGIVSSIVVTGAFVAGAGIWNMVVSTFLLYFVILISFTYGTKDVTKLDAMFAIGAGLAIIPWYLTKDPTISIVLATGIYLLSMAPTVRKTWNDPYSEPWTIWSVNAIKHVFAIAALSAFSIATLFYPAAIIAMNIVFVSMVLYRRHHQKSV